jgi:hypothetical protein
MQPSRQTRQWHVEWQSRPGSSMGHGETQRGLHGSYMRRDIQDHDAWPPRSTSPLQQRRHANSSVAPSWRDRVNLRESQVQGGTRWRTSEAEEPSQRRQPPVRRWRSPEPPLRWRSAEFYSSSDSRSWAQRDQDLHPSRAPRPLASVSRLGDGHAPDPFVHERWDSEVPQDARSTRPQCVVNTSHDNDDDGDDDEEGSNEQSNFTLGQHYLPPARSYERWHNVRADPGLHRTEGPIRLSNDDHVGVLHNQVPSWPAHKQRSRTSRIVEMPARRWSQSVKRSQGSQSETCQERATQSLTTNAVYVQSYTVGPTRQQWAETGRSASSMDRRPPRTFEAGQAPSLVVKHDERADDGDDIWSENDVQSTSKRRPSALGKRKATLKRDVATVDYGCEHSEEVVVITPKVLAGESGTDKPRDYVTRKRCRKRCQYPDGCDKGAIGRTLFCRAHGGGKRCQYPEGCGSSARGSTMLCRAHGGGGRCQYPDDCNKGVDGRTMFCIAHGGGKRCKYPDGCGKSAQGSTMFCAAHGGGKRCQYPDGCGKSAQGSTMFCAAHGGGKRCQYPEGCGKSARGSTMFCAAHGGGKRCQYPEGCSKGAYSSTMFCIAHGGGKRCQYPEVCGKIAPGATMFCKTHGGGKRCQYPEGCSKSAQGSTMFCKAHGGGGRCQYPDGCDKSAQSSTMFCRAHGGGRRCGHQSGCRKHVIRRGLCKSHGADAGV